ncbi:hypothetical protein I4U23_030249 [Adineta vaga]|nr:hypothetical protein I4U23_030249 [Adineta vaga]
MADKIGQFSIENQEMARELSLDQSDAPGESLFQSMKSWNIPVGWYLWVKFTECMRLIVQYGCDQKHPSIEIQQTLDRLTCFDTPQQLDDLVNRCVDLYKTLIYIIQINDHLPITESNIRCYEGNASQSAQGNVIVLFRICYINPKRAYSHYYDDNVQEYIVKYMRAFNDQDHISDNHDATANIQESENSDSLYMLLPLLPNINVLSDNDDLTLSTGTLAVQNQSDLASIWLKEAFPDSIMSNPNSSFDMAFAADDIPHRPKTTTASSENHEEMPGHPAMETTDGKLMINDDLQGRKLILNNICHRRACMLGDLAKKKCPLVQAGEKRQQKVYPKIEIKSASAEYLRVRAVTKNYEPHPLQCVAPENVQVNLEFFDPSLECTYLPIDDEERRNHQKIVKVHLFNWKKSGSISKEVSQRENLRLCRLEFRLCKLSSEGEYECISSPCYTSIIDQDNFIPR